MLHSSVYTAWGYGRVRLGPWLQPTSPEFESPYSLKEKVMSAQPGENSKDRKRPGERTSRLRTEREMLLEKCGYKCYWCQLPVTWKYIKNGGEQPDNLATIEHMESQFARAAPGVPPKVIACRICNNLRSTMECMILYPASSKHERRRRRFAKELEILLISCPIRLKRDLAIRFPVYF